ncbi:hypothetical protein [Vreelandella titanicae]|uniref:Uncharacterized protein n=1 Tax=Vreelandella titanicae TaxID=664683 RepID=A0AAP9NM25_9GAMM|nr:hypothetical protein [Halomonas titanicae]QKS24602.1 hypothetical protein FX987_02384 [Halomonas titanicae]
MKFKLLKDAPYIGKMGDVINVENKHHIAIMKFNRYIDKEYIEPKAKAKRTTKKDTHTDSDSK